MKVRNIIFILMSFLILSCSKAKYENDRSYYAGSVSGLSKEILFPVELKPIVDAEYIKYMKSLGAPFDIQTDDEILSRRAREYLNVNLYLYAERPGALEQDTVFRLPQGGGVVDLKNTVRGSKGSFYTRFYLEKSSNPDEKINSFRVYYLSGAKVKDLSDEAWGAGCGAFMELTSLMKNRGMRKGVLANATDGRHALLLSGYYYFIAFSKEKMYMASVELLDSKYREYMCPYVEKT
jgi:hypothetical protein